MRTERAPKKGPSTWEKAEMTMIQTMMRAMKVSGVCVCVCIYLCVCVCVCIYLCVCVSVVCIWFSGMERIEVYGVWGMVCGVGCVSWG